MVTGSNPSEAVWKRFFFNLLSLDNEQTHFKTNFTVHFINYILNNLNESGYEWLESLTGNRVATGSNPSEAVLKLFSSIYFTPLNFASVFRKRLYRSCDVQLSAMFKLTGLNLIISGFFCQV